MGASGGQWKVCSKNKLAECHFPPCFTDNGTIDSHFPNEHTIIVEYFCSGKSTLLKAITEEIPYDGTITIGTTQVLGYLQQTAVSGSTKTVLEEAKSAQEDIEQARQALERAQEKVSNSISVAPSEQDLLALDRATQQYEAVGGYQQEQQVSTMLKGLGFVDLTQPCNELSGGWQMRVSNG
jgi:ATP-binding cassette, subfamily F, member 3